MYKTDKTLLKNKQKYKIVFENYKKYFDGIF